MTPPKGGPRLARPRPRSPPASPPGTAVAATGRIWVGIEGARKGREGGRPTSRARVLLVAGWVNP